MINCILETSYSAIDPSNDTWHVARKTLQKSWLQYIHD